MRLTCELGDGNDITVDTSFKEQLMSVRYQGIIFVRSLGVPDLDPDNRHYFSTLTPNWSIVLHLQGRMDTLCSALLAAKSGYDYEVQFRLFKGLHSFCDVK